MTLRSWLFVPGDSEKKIGKAKVAGADALILDLEDAVAPAGKLRARALIREFLQEQREQKQSQLWVRINPLQGDLALADLAAVMPGRPDGIMLPKVNGPADVQRLSYYLDVLEQQYGIAAGTVRIVPVATETARAPFALGDYATAGLNRLAGLTWGAEDIAAAMGASTNLDETGQWALTFRLVRSLTLLGAHAAGVQAIETLYVDFLDLEGLRAASRAARAEGFTGRIAIHPGQVAIINAAFMPSEGEILFARRVVAAFEATPSVGTLNLDGRMLDLPHLTQARALLAGAQAAL